MQEVLGFAMRSLSFAIRLPLVVGLAVFVSSICTTHLAVHVMQREMEQEIVRLADVYMDSLSGAALPPLRSGDFQALAATLERGMGFQQGIGDLSIVVADRKGRVLAQAGEARGTPPLAQGLLGTQWIFNEREDTAWAQKELVEDGQAIALVAVQLAFPHQAERRSQLVWVLSVVDFLLAGTAALIAAIFSRKLMKPFFAVTAALSRAGAGRFEPLNTTGAGWGRDVEANRLAQAFNTMIASLREREELAIRLADRERAAVLGRLSATLAHEVRNPLAGMLTALDTIRRFGADRAARERAVDLVERGLRQIEAVVRTTLATHRQDEEGRPLSAADLEDLKLLVLPEARRRGVSLGWEIDLPRPFQADALRVRQLLLNLLLNAVTASPAGRQVSLAVTREGEDMLVRVEDEAGGLPPEGVELLSGHASAQGIEGRLGLEIAAQLAAALNATITVVPGGAGSLILLRIPSRAEGRP